MSAASQIGRRRNVNCDAVVLHEPAAVFSCTLEGLCP